MEPTKDKGRAIARCFWLAGLFLLCIPIEASGSNVPLLAVVSGSSKLFEWRPFLAPFHSVLLHYPIGFVTMAFILEIYGLFRPSEELRKITRLTIWLSLASAFAVAALGMMRAGSGDYDRHTLSLHRVFGMSVPFCILLTLLAHRSAHQTERPRLLLGYRGLLTTTLVVLVIAGHQGGNLTHGSRYLVQNAPNFFKSLLDEPDPLGTNLENAKPSGSLFAARIQPLLEAKCLRCHGAEKHKGGYRLDLPESALKGGESGQPAIKPREPLQSNLVRLILLPRDNDEAMPPEGKEPLTPDETMLVVRWIQAGASFGESGNVPEAHEPGAPRSGGQ